MVQIEIVPRGSLDLEMMRDLGALDASLREADLDARAASAVVPGAKDVGLAAAISIAGLALSAVSTLVSVLSYWSSQRPKYTVTLSSKGLDRQVSGLDKQGVLAVAKGLAEESDVEQIVVRVEKA